MPLVVLDMINVEISWDYHTSPYMVGCNGRKRLD